MCFKDPHRAILLYLPHSTLGSEVRVSRGAASLEVEANTTMCRRQSLRKQASAEWPTEGL